MASWQDDITPKERRYAVLSTCHFVKWHKQMCRFVNYVLNVPLHYKNGFSVNRFNFKINIYLVVDSSVFMQRIEETALDKMAS